jgi:hypothetical protein
VTLEWNITWSKNPDAWLAEVRDGDGNLIDFQIGLDADDVFLDLHEDITPPDA